MKFPQGQLVGLIFANEENSRTNFWIHENQILTKNGACINVKKTKDLTDVNFNNDAKSSFVFKPKLKSFLKIVKELLKRWISPRTFCNFHVHFPIQRKFNPREI